MVFQVHLPPIFAIIAISALHFKGYYMGDKYFGNSTDKVQNLNQLLLYITAKVLVKISMLLLQGSRN